MKISLICATYNRLTELNTLLESLTVQINKDFELIVVDQNKNSLIDKLCSEYKTKLNLVHIKSDKLGLSTNRNIGISFATGDVLGFPDDDCIYYPETTQNIAKFFLENDNVELLYGKIYDRNLRKNIMRDWPSDDYIISSLKDIMLYTSSIVIFIRKSGVFFDENFGVNQKFGGGEDIEICYRHFIGGAVLQYSPDVEVNHPEVSANFLNYQKAYNYGRGWGAFFAKYFNVRILPLFIGILGYTTLLILKDFIMLKASAKGRIYSLLGRGSGFINYLSSYKK